MSALGQAIDWSAVLAVLSVYVTGVIIPGPNFVAVLHKAASASRAEALAVVAGIVIVNLFWAGCAILGVGIVFAAFPWVALAVKIAGAGYLLWFGARLIGKASARARAEPGRQPQDGGLRASFVQGFLTNIANPKSVAFFAAVFASATPAHVSWPTFAAMLCVVLVVAGSWYSFLALAMSHGGVAARYRKSTALVDRLCGSLIVFLGIRQLLR
ncbi:LysE family translocator [Herbaspirillum sp. LeCh32-8]|uniref:LysE family translocator n=1 Tax=Herbaspirillum sp. LeCh32-8 TaxID=2821356 RepID=UPI001AE5CE29|nr:LysE family translocator [Herbaspirillum sp. LeCh32-8]MBP0598682.1 LysE family translocator [Herbaspirillum sp. LeCh32-8]